MPTPAWVRALYAQHHQWVEQALQHAPLTPQEHLEHARCYSLIEAYEQWDGGGQVALLALALLRQEIRGEG